MDNVRERTIEAWGNWVADLIEAGWTPYLLSFMFEPLGGSERPKMHQMERALEAAYGIFVKRVIRRPRSGRAQGRLPIWICSPDLPVFKGERSKKTGIRDVKLNDGLHYHAVLLLPPQSRIDDIEGHFEGLRPTYRRLAHLDRVDVEPIVESAAKVVEYVQKQILKMRFDAGDIFILPRSLSELPAEQRSVTAGACMGSGLSGHAHAPNGPRSRLQDLDQTDAL